MKKLSLLLIGLLLVPTLFFTSCDRGDDPSDGTTAVATPSFTLMKEYMVQNDLDINKVQENLDGKFVVGAPATLAAVDGFLDTYYIMDIRNNTDFLTAHVNGANNVAFADILTDAPNAGTKPILVVCYTGQTACYATALLRMYGFPKTRALKWGMSGWNSTTATSWNNAITGNPAATSPNWTYSSAPSNVVYSDPVITSISSDGEVILKERVEAIVNLGFQGVNGADVIANPGNYFVNNYFSEADYSGFGHISNAYRIKEDLLLSTNGYQGLDPSPSANMASYCYTGQTSAVLTAWLRVLGYDAYSLKFGMNGLYNSNPVWATNKWSSSVPKDYPVFSN